MSSLDTHFHKIAPVFKGLTHPTLRNFLAFSLSMVLEGSNCLEDIKVKFSALAPGRTEDSTFLRAYERIRYLLNEIKGPEVVWNGLILLIINMLPLTSPLTLVLDRTNWKRGKESYNLLFISVVLADGSSFPIIWVALDKKKGCTSTWERLGLLDKLWALGKGTFAGSVLIGDREFTGIEWMQELTHRSISFVFRIRDNMYLKEVATAMGWKNKNILARIRHKVQQNGFFITPIVVKGQCMSFVVGSYVTKDGKQKFLHLVSNLTDAKEVLRLYQQRWSIECCFKKLKTDGFQLEDLALQCGRCGQALNTTIAAMLLGYVLTIEEGRTEAEKNPIRKILQKNGKFYNAKSLFKVGKDNIKSKINSLETYILRIIQYLAEKLSIPIKISLLPAKIFP